MKTLDEQAQAAVAAIDHSFGRHDGHRVVHAKGVLCRGTFVAAPVAAELTTAAHMQGAEIGATVRFSNAGSNPHVDDRVRDGRGMAVAFYLPDGSGTDILAINLPCFVVATPDDFVAFTRAAKPLVGELPGPGLVWFLLRHRNALPAAQAALKLKPPESFATQRYNALHAYQWTAPDGTTRNVRYTWRPAAGEKTLSSTKDRSHDYLMEEIHERLTHDPVVFDLEIQVAQPGDPLTDATQAWPEARERITVGTLTLTGPDTEREQGDDILVFDPTRVTDGIALAGDPLPPLRSHAYSISVERRTGATRPEEI